MDFKNDVRLRTPKLYKGILSTYFPTIASWTSDYIINKYGTRTCKYSFHGRPVAQDNETTYSNFFNNNVGYTFTRTSSASSYFVDEVDWDVNTLFTKDDILRTIFFAGPKNTGALPHRHGDAFNLCVEGKKQWIMFDTITKEGLDLQKRYKRDYPVGSLWKTWYDNEYKSINVPIIEFTQLPGDIVYVPRGYSHTVYNHEQTLGIVFETKC